MLNRFITAEQFVYFEFKGIVQPKMKMSTFTHPLSFLLWNTKKIFFWGWGWVKHCRILFFGSAIPERHLQSRLINLVLLHRVICFYPAHLIWLTVDSFQPSPSNLIMCTKNRDIRRWMVKCKVRRAEVSHLPLPSRWHEDLHSYKSRALTGKGFKSPNRPCFEPSSSILGNFKMAFHYMQTSPSPLKGNTLTHNYSRRWL